MSTKFAVVAWCTEGGTPLNPEQVEVCSLKKIIIKDSTPKCGSSVSLQVKQTLWEGTIEELGAKTA